MKTTLIAVLIVSTILVARYLFMVFGLFHSQSAPERLSAFVIGAEYLDKQNVVFQTSSNNCGAAALKMIFDYHRLYLPLKKIDSGLIHTNTGISMSELKRFAVSEFLQADGWRLTYHDLKFQRFPMIAFIRQHHFVVLDSISDDEIYFRDPSIGRMKIDHRAFARIWKGESLIFH